MSTPDADLLLFDPASLGGSEGAERLKALTNRAGHQPVVVLAVSETEPYTFAALQAGAVGCVLTGWSEDERRAALDEVWAGGVVLPPLLARLVLLALTQPVPPGHPRAPELNEAEAAVLHVLGNGTAWYTAGAQLGLSVDAVRSCLRGALAKLQHRAGADDDGLHRAGVPRRPSPGHLTATAEASLEEDPW